MDLQNLSYAAIQVVHNFGAVAVAVAVVGSAACALWLEQQFSGMRKLAWLMMAGWAAQAASGGAFGFVSWLYYGRFPDIHGIAVAALAATALTAAAVLRWFS